MKPPMRLLVCGGRDYANRAKLFETLDYIHANRGISCVIEGGARGADQLARSWAQARGVPFEEYPADWNTLGKRAGIVRNKQMLEEGKPDGVLAFPGGTGTQNMMNQAFERGLPISRVFS